MMAISMICIMMYHQTWITHGAFFEWIHLLGYLGVEVFLFISGFGIAHSLRKNPIDKFYKNRIIRLLPACLIWGLLQIALSNIPSMPPSQSLILDLFALSHWYIYALVVYYISAPFIYKVIARWGGYWLLFAIVIATYIAVFFWEYDADAPYFIMYGRWVVKRFPVFVFGMLIALKPIQWSLSRITLLGMLFFLTNLVVLHFIIVVNANPTTMDFPARLFSFLPNRTNIPDNGRYILDMLSVLFLCPCFALTAYFLKKVRILTVVNYIGSYSLEIYLCHQYIFKALWKIETEPYIGLAIGCAASFVIAYIIRIAANPVKTLAIKYLQ